MQTNRQDEEGVPEGRGDGAGVTVESTRFNVGSTEGTAVTSGVAETH